MAAAGRAVVPDEEEAGLNQALVLQCSLVTLRDRLRKSREEEQSKKFLSEGQKDRLKEVGVAWPP